MSIFNYDVTQFFPSLQLTLHEAAQTRLRLTTTALGLEPGRTRVIMFGGCPKWEWKKSGYNQPELALTAVLEFGKKTRLHNCGVLVSLLISFHCILLDLNMNILICVFCPDWGEHERAPH